MAEPFLVCDNLSKRFGETLALDAFSVSLAKGEVLALLGPSGCGKTTVLNILQGLLATESGSIRCDGLVIDDPAARAWTPMRTRAFATVFQDFSLWPHMTVEQNIGYGLRVRGVPRADLRASVDRALALVGLAGMGRRRPGELSGGQQQRVAIARAVVVKPRVLLLDEPLSALDARLREGLRDDLAILLRETGCTAVYVTHDQSEAFAIADRVALMNRGRIEQIGPPTALYHEPASVFVASFIGASNILDADARRRMGVRDHDAAPAWLLRRERVAVRPVGRDALSDGTLSVDGVCQRSLFLGDRYEIVLRTHAGDLLRGLGAAPIVPGAPVRAELDLDSVRVLPR